MSYLAWLEQDYREVNDPMGRHLTLRLSAMQRDQQLDYHCNTLFGALSDECWTHRYTMPHKYTNFEAADGNIKKLYKSCWEAATELTELSDLDKVFLMETAYNPFTLLRNIDNAHDRDLQRHIDHAQNGKPQDFTFQVRLASPRGYCSN